MRLILNVLTLMSFLINSISSDWVEIPQVHKKRLLINKQSANPITELPIQLERPEIFATTTRKPLETVDRKLEIKSLKNSTELFLKNVTPKWHLATVENFVNVSTSTAKSNEDDDYDDYIEIEDGEEDSDDRENDETYLINGLPDQEPLKEKDDNHQSSTFSFSSLMPLLKDIQETLTKNKQKSKLTILKEIRDEILMNIHERISKLWGGSRTNDKPVLNKRTLRTFNFGNNDGTNDRRRVFKDKEHSHDHHEDIYIQEHEHESEHHIEFPSNEGALLALAFLTFAAFLVKLVLQIIDALKMKNAALMSTTTTTMATRFRRSPEEEYETTTRILGLIDSYPYQ